MAQIAFAACEDLGTARSQLAESADDAEIDGTGRRNLGKLARLYASADLSNGDYNKVSMPRHEGTRYGVRRPGRYQVLP